VRDFRIVRAFFALLCIALLLSSTAGGAAHVDLWFPVLVFCFLVELASAQPCVSERASAAQQLSFLNIHTSRAPPVA
jgi:hypothetical protein